ncbi:MAG: nucleotide exchange factor GrpE [Eubacterium sp.]|nr:nucleotide exchange factor GrpE [Eubacterium sp.]
MKPVIGVHFWERQARLSFCDEDSVNVAAVDLPSDIKRLNIIANDFSIKKAFEVIDKFIKEQLNVSDYSLVFCTSDDTGLKEIQLLYKCALECNVEVITTVTETMAMAYYSYVEYSLNGPAIMAFASPAKLGVAQYYIEEGVIETEDTFIAGRWNGSSLYKSEFLSSGSKRFFDMNEAGVIICSGSMDKCLAFDNAIKNYISTSNTFYNKNIEFKMIEDQCVTLGIGFICGKLEGRNAFQGLNEVNTLSAYDIFVSVNGEIYPMFDMDSIIPIEEKIEIENYPESKKAYDDIVIFEKRGKSFVKVCQMNIPKEELEYFYHKACHLILSADKNRRLTLTIKSIMGDKEMSYKILDHMSSGEEEEVKTESISDMLVKLLPIFDDLEYAYKYAQEKDNPYVLGIKKTYDKAIQILEENGVELITGEGKEFDYNTQTAVMHITDLDMPDNTVKQVMQAGYIYKGKVLRPASVVVAN